MGASVIGAATRMLRALVVDDEEVLREVAQMHLEQWMFQVTTAKDVYAGIEFLKGEQFDIVLTDFSTPRGCGLDLLMAVRRLNLRTPVFIISGSWTDRDEQIARSLGAKTFYKPCDWEVLRQSIVSTLGGTGR